MGNFDARPWLAWMPGHIQLGCQAMVSTDLTRRVVSTDRAATQPGWGGLRPRTQGGARTHGAHGPDAARALLLLLHLV